MISHMTFRLYMLVSLFTALTLVCSSIAFAGQLPVLNWSERSDWINVKTDVTPNAVGDGVADDTAAIQAALNTAGNGVTVYFPAGTYKVTGTLTLNGGISHYAMNLIGHGRSTILAWFGAADGYLFTINGNSGSRYVGLTLDGRNLAASGFRHYNTNGWFETSIRYQHVGLYNFTGNAIDAVPGDSSAMAETMYENCIFDHCAVGMRMGGFNDYDHTFAGCDFIACGTGIVCNHGNFYARECYFSGSTVTDIQASPEHGCSVRRCKSIGSAKFISFSNSVSPCPVQDCYVDAWTGTSGAISHWNTPLVLSYCRFVNPPDTNAPVRCAGRVILCDNVAPSSNAVATGSKLYTVPTGSYIPRVGSTAGAKITSFVNPNITVPPVVYDAKVNFGATGNGTSDDTIAIQNCINAARAAGGGAIAYIPTGTYKITSTLNITGSNYVVGGSGYFARLKWAGVTGGIMVAVADPDNVRLENMMIGHHDLGTTNNGIDIAQTSTGAISKMTYESVYVYGKYQRAPETKGLYLNGLGKNCMVILNLVEGNIRLNNSGDATLLGNVTYEGSIVVDDVLSTRAGFQGFIVRLNTIADYGIIIRNSNSLVVSDWYTEQAYNGILLSGSSSNPAGRLTLQGANTDFGSHPSGVMLTINDYKGKLFYGSDQFYAGPTTETINQTGTNPLDIILYANAFYNPTLTFNATSASLYTVGNTGNGAPADSYTDQTLDDMTLAFDDLQHLGTLDLALNFPFIDLSMPTQPTADPQSVTTTEDTPKAITLTGSDPNDDPLTFAIVTPPAHGTLTGTAPTLTYTPGVNYHGSDSFTFKVNDNQEDSAPATVSITVQATKLEGDAAPRPLGSATLTTSDWVQVGRFAVKLDTPTAGGEFQRADCAPRATFGDGTVTVADWVQAGRYIVGIDVPVLAGGPTAPPTGLTNQHILANAQALAVKTPRVVSLAHTTLVRGRTGTVALVLRGQGTECALDGTLRFDPARLQFVGATATDRTTTLLLNSTRAAQGQVALSLMRPLPRTFPAGDTTVVTLLFRVPPTAPRGIAPITFGNNLAVCTIVNAQAETLPATFTAGVVTIR